MGTTTAGAAPVRPRDPKERRRLFNHEVRTVRWIVGGMHLIVLVLSVLLIFFISWDTFKKADFLENDKYMTFQLWVCLFFILDFFVEWVLSCNRNRYFWHRLVFLLLSIPYLNIITGLDIQVTHDALFFVRFIPLARGALALAIVISYLSSNAVTSMFISYLAIMLLIMYFCSIVFYMREVGVNKDVDTYWTALWWTAMNLTTVGCYINPVTVAGRIVAVILPASGMIMFPLFTVYLTDYVRRNSRHDYIAPGHFNMVGHRACESTTATFGASADERPLPPPVPSDPSSSAPSEPTTPAATDDHGSAAV